MPGRHPHPSRVLPLVVALVWIALPGVAQAQQTPTLKFPVQVSHQTLATDEVNLPGGTEYRDHIAVQGFVLEDGKMDFRFPTTWQQIVYRNEEGRITGIEFPTAEDAAAYNQFAQRTATALSSDHGNERVDARIGAPRPVPQRPHTAQAGERYPIDSTRQAFNAERTVAASPTPPGLILFDQFLRGRQTIARTMGFEPGGEPDHELTGIDRGTTLAELGMTDEDVERLKQNLQAELGPQWATRLTKEHDIAWVADVYLGADRDGKSTFFYYDLTNPTSNPRMTQQLPTPTWEEIMAATDGRSCDLVGGADSAASLVSAIGQSYAAAIEQAKPMVLSLARAERGLLDGIPATHKKKNPPDGLITQWTHAWDDHADEDATMLQAVAQYWAAHGAIDNAPTKEQIDDLPSGQAALNARLLPYGLRSIKSSGNHVSVADLKNRTRNGFPTVVQLRMDDDTDLPTSDYWGTHDEWVIVKGVYPPANEGAAEVNQRRAPSGGVNINRPVIASRGGGAPYTRPNWIILQRMDGSETVVRTTDFYDSWSEAGRESILVYPREGHTPGRIAPHRLEEVGKPDAYDDRFRDVDPAEIEPHERQFGNGPAGVAYDG